jgi:tetratricopeptide (TPR) repeat protein
MDTELENKLLDKLKDSSEDSEEIMEQLAMLYHKEGEPMKAVPYLHQLITNTQDADKVAHHYLSLGQSMEKMENYESAVLYYSQALSVGTKDKTVWYFIHNNLGFCLNVTGKYVEAEKFCKEAINIDPFPANAYKNMGISLESQGRILEAAMAYKTGWLANPFDGRSYQHLRSLISRHKEYEHILPRNRREFIMEQKKFVESHGGTYDISSLEDD